MSGETGEEQGTCEACGGKGWLDVLVDGERPAVERCDQCERFATDLAAYTASRYDDLTVFMRDGYPTCSALLIDAFVRWTAADEYERMVERAYTEGE